MVKKITPAILQKKRALMRREKELKLNIKGAERQAEDEVIVNFMKERLTEVRKDLKDLR